MVDIHGLADSVGQARAAIDAAATAEEAQSATLDGLATAVQAAVTLLMELRSGQTTEEQAAIDAVMVHVNALMDTASASAARSAAQSTKLASLRDEIATATANTPPAPPATP